MIKDLLKNRNFVLFWLSSMFSELGVMTLQFVISLYVFDLTGSAVLYGTLLFIVIAPRLVLFPLVGVWADLYDRKRLLVLSTGYAFFVLVVFTGIDFLVGDLQVVHLFILVILLEVFNIVFLSTNVTIVPMIVEESQFGAANSLGMIYSDFGYIIGPMIGALLYGLLGLKWAMILVIVFIALGLVFILGLRLPPIKRLHTLDRTKTGLASLASDLAVGVRLILRDRLVLVLFILAPLFNFFCVPIWEISLLYFVRGDLGMDAIFFGVFSSLQAVGDVVIALVIAKIYSDGRAFRFIRRYPLLVAASLGVILLGGFLLGLAHPYPVLVLVFIGSSCMAMLATYFIICRNTMVQKRIAQDAQSRVFSICRLASMLAFPLGGLVYGFLTEHSGLVGSVVVSLIGMSAAWFLTRRLRADEQSATYSAQDPEAQERQVG